MVTSVGTSDFDARFLDRLVGTKLTTFEDIDPPQEPSAISPSDSGNSASMDSLPMESPPGIFPHSGPLTTASPPPPSQTTASYAHGYPTAVSTATAPSLSIPGSLLLNICRSWVITESSPRERSTSQRRKSREVLELLTVGIFLCHPEEDPDQMAFMRIYYQIPITGTEYANPATRAQQSGGPPEICGEREAFKMLMSQDCTAVPHFLGYDEKMQKGDDLVPGGYIKYAIWGKVPGESLTEEFFWSLDRPTRDDIRATFRVAYESAFWCPAKKME